MEEGHLLSCQGVYSEDAIRFRQITRSAGKRAVLFCVRTAQRHRHDMFQVKVVTAHMLWGLAVFIASAGTLLDPSAQRTTGHGRRIRIGKYRAVDAVLQADACLPE